MALAKKNNNEELRKMWMRMNASLANTTDAASASKTDNAKVEDVPLIILGVRESGPKPTRYVTAIVGPFGAFSGYAINYKTLPDGRRVLETIRDTRPAKVREDDEKNGRTFPESTYSNIEDVQGTLDRQCKHRFIRKRFVEHDIIQLEDDSVAKSAKPGVICMAAVEPLIWHHQKDESYKILSKNRIKRVMSTVYLPPSDFINWIIEKDIWTSRFHTLVPKYVEMDKLYPATVTKAELDDAAHPENYVTIVTGLPQDWRNPRFMQPDSCMLFDETDRTETTSFVYENTKENIKTPALQLKYKGMQWRGERENPEYTDTDMLFAAFPNIKFQHLRELDISSPENWKKLFAPVYDMLLGVFVGKENCREGSKNELNQGRLSALDGSAEEQIEQMNEPVGSHELSFGMHLSIEAFMFDAVDFIRTVCPRVSPEKIKERWGGSTQPKNIGLQAPKELSTSKLVICLSEISTSTDVSSILTDPKYDFRVLTVACPLKKSEKREVYSKLSGLSAKQGDQFLDFVNKCVIPGEGEDEYFEINPDIDEDHPARKYRFKADKGTEYFFAINETEWSRRRESALNTMRNMKDFKALGGDNSLKRDADDAQLQIEDGSAKRQKSDNHSDIDIDDDDIVSSADEDPDMED